MKSLFKLTLATIKGFYRDRTALFWFLLFPLFFILLFGAVFSNEDMGQFEIGLVVEDTSPIAKGLSQAFNSVPMFIVSEGEYEEEIEKLRNGDLQAVVVIPEGLSASIMKGEGASLNIYYDESRSIASQTVLSILREVINRINQEITQHQDLVKAEQIPLQAKRLRTIDFFVPGILAMSIMQGGLFAADLLVSQREKHILKRLGATPLRRSTLVISQAIFRLILALVQASIIIWIGNLVFKVQMVGNWLNLYLLVILGSLTFLSMAYMVASFTRTEESCIAVTQMLNFPMMFLSGIFFPIEFMPDFIKPIIKIIPLSYLGDAFRQIMNNGRGLLDVSNDIFILLGWMIVCSLISFRFFRWD